jgi:excisionase family DNA binding protein
LELVFQPIFDLQTGRVVAVDTVGARDPERPGVPPRWLLNIAEDLQLGVEFASWVLRRACEDRSAWIRERAERNGPHVVVPIPAQMLNAPDLEARIRACVAQTDTSLAGVAIEIDERILTDAAPQIEAPLRALGEDGLRVYIGGFGKGITSISRVRSVPVDGLKGASSFVEGLPGPADLRLLSALVSLGRAADIAIVAEGITSADHLHALQDIGCPLGMGSLLGGPMNAAGIAGLRNQPFTPDIVHGRTTPARAQEPASDHGPTLPIGIAADTLRISPSTLRRLADDGRIRSTRTAGGHRRFPVSEIRRLGGATLPARPLLRLQPAIHTPRPELADLLLQHGHRLATRAARNMYAGDPGWFARPEARGPLDDWITGIAAAVRHGDQTVLTRICADLSDHAAANGALLLETLTFIAAFLGSVEYTAGRAGTAPEAALDVRRITNAARQAILLHVDNHD